MHYSQTNGTGEGRTTQAILATPNSDVTDHNLRPRPIRTTQDLFTDGTDTFSLVKFTLNDINTSSSHHFDQSKAVKLYENKNSDKKRRDQNLTASVNHNNDVTTTLCKTVGNQATPFLLLSHQTSATLSQTVQNNANLINLIDLSDDLDINHQILSDTELTDLSNSNININPNASLALKDTKEPRS